VLVPALKRRIGMNCQRLGDARPHRYPVRDLRLQL